MFHWQNENPLNSTNLSEVALYAVAFPSVATASFGGIRPQGQYPAFPFSSSECDEAKQAGLSGSVSMAKRQSRLCLTTGTIAATVIMQVAGTNQFPLLCATRRSERWAVNAGRTRSVAYPKQDMSLRGNDGNLFLSHATAMGASANASAMFAVMHG